MGSNFVDMVPIFRQLSAEWSAPHSTPLKPFLVHVHGMQSDPSSLRILVTDFMSNTYEALKSRIQLEDMRDNIGIGGPWSEFVDYITDSLKLEAVKLVLEGQAKEGGASHAKLIAQKAKGMPRISIFLDKLVDGAACGAMANLSMELYKEYKRLQSSLVKEQERSSRVAKLLATEQDKNESIQKQLDMISNSRKNKVAKINDRASPGSGPIMSSQDSPDKQGAQVPTLPKVPTRAVPAYRRAKVRGAILDDNEDDMQM